MVTNYLYEVEFHVGACKVRVHADTLESLKVALKNFDETILNDINLVSKALPVTKTFAQQESGISVPSMSDFLKKFTSDTERVLACIYYLLKFKDVKNVTAKTISTSLTDARAKVPENINAFLNSLTSQKFVSESGEKIDGLKNWFITLDGEAAIEALLAAR